MDAAVGWWRHLSADERKRFRAAKGGQGKSVAHDLWRAACATHARTAIVQVQDLLGLGSSARTNTPGTASGNWSWRVRRADLTPALAKRTRELLESTDRAAGRA